jgi:hypothetical protein
LAFLPLQLAMHTDLRIFRVPPRAPLSRFKTVSTEPAVYGDANHKNSRASAIEMLGIKVALGAAPVARSGLARILEKQNHLLTNARIAEKT